MNTIQDDYPLNPFALRSLLQMLKQYAGAYFAIGVALETISNLSRYNPAGDIALALDTIESVLEAVAVVQSGAEKIDLPNTAKGAKRLLESPPKTHNEVVIALGELQRRLYDEIESILWKYVSEGKAQYYETTPLFGAKVSDNFPSAMFDIEEAGKCFALDRYTGCVMHLMRALEVALKGVGNTLGIMTKIKSAQPDWGSVLRAIDVEIQQRNSKKDAAWLIASRFYEEIYADLRAVKTAWRNPSMHADKSYDEERAQEIFDAVKSWMRHLADHLDETGTFTA